MKLSALAALLFTAPLVSAANFDAFSGAKVFRLDVPSPTVARRINELVERYHLDLWTDKITPGYNTDVSVPARYVKDFEARLMRLGIRSEVMHEDLGKSIQEESKPLMRALAEGEADDWFLKFHSYDEHSKWLDKVHSDNPDNTELVTAGQSTQGRPIKGIHIWGKDGKGSKPAAIFHGNVHAREWITSKVVEYFVTKLVNKDEPVASKYDYYIFPVVNPDGFIESQTNNRMKRKNMARTSSSCGGGFGREDGTDINRNWPYKWDISGGASTNPCAQDYKGSKAGDSVENQGLSKFIDDLAAGKNGAKIYIDWHSYSQMLMSPYGYTCSAHPPDHDEFVKTLLPGWAAAVKKKYGTTFRTGPICETIYQVSGGSTDYTYGKSGIKYSMAVELRDTGRYGFVLPPEQIVPSCEESWDGLKYLLENTK